MCVCAFANEHNETKTEHSISIDQTGNVWSNWNATQISFTMKWFQYRELSNKAHKTAMPKTKNNIIYFDLWLQQSHLIHFDILVTIHIKLSTFHCRFLFSSFSSRRLLYRSIRLVLAISIGSRHQWMWPKRACIPSKIFWIQWNRIQLFRGKRNIIAILCILFV